MMNRFHIRFRFQLAPLQQGMRALLLLLGSCKEVAMFGFEGGTSWYFDKVRNRGFDDKMAHGAFKERRRWPRWGFSWEQALERR